MNLFTLIIIGMFLFAVLETPLFTIIAGLSIACFFFIDNEWASIQTIVIEMNRLASMPVLVALPLFTFSGCLLAETGAPMRIMNLMGALTGRIPGGIAVAAICSCAFFTALTGASGVTIVAIGSLLYPVLLRQEYDENFSLGLLTTSGSLGLLFAPSLPVILYGVVAQVDAAVIFKAALVPGILLVLLLSAYAFFHAPKQRAHSPLLSALSKDSQRSCGGELQYVMPDRKDAHKKKTGWKDVWNALKEGIWEWPIPLVIIAGIYGGFTTIAEVSALVLVYVVAVECFVLREIDFSRRLPGIIIESVIVSGAIIIILGFALGFTGYLVDEEIPGRLLGYLVNLTENKYYFLAGLNLFLLAVGCLMDIFSAIVIIVPVIVPIAVQYGIDPVHLGIIFLLNLEIGYSTPPVGINLFIAGLKFGKPVTQLYRASVPYLLIMLLLLAAITYIPALSLFLVR
ncbi:MAG: TRAP transporter large permease subunit [Desulfobacterales bacterium]|nr:TRAP transporter large permease subunit [Desulfobacterales bacterium]